MDTTSALSRFEATLAEQLALIDDPAVETAAQALTGALRPAARELAMELAQQAAEELAAQLPDREVQVVLQEREPTLVVREQPAGNEAPPASDEGYEARLTLRLPPSIKERIEEAAETAGDSVNRWVVDALATSSRPTARPGRRVQGRIRT